MRFIFYTYSDTGILTLDYDDGHIQRKILYIGYPPRQAIGKFRWDYNLTRKHIKVIKLY